MNGPLRTIRSGNIEGFRNLANIYEWVTDKAYLVIDRVSFKGNTGAILCYYNPPVHEVGNPGLDAYLEGIERVNAQKEGLEFFILSGASDPVHAGGDLRESLSRLDKTLEAKKEKEAANASAEEVDHLFDWADSRLYKGIALHQAIRKLAESLRVVAACAGGTRYGGSAEVPLMCDYIVADSRSALCFSEATIGLVPGWAGIARVLVKAGPLNAAYMAKTASEVKAGRLKEIGIFNEVVEVPLAFPRREADKDSYQRAMDAHDYETGLILLPRVLEMATRPVEEIIRAGEGSRKYLDIEENFTAQVARRANPENYTHICGKPLVEVKSEISKLGKPLAPQSIKGIEGLLHSYNPSNFDEFEFARREVEADARCYRDPRFRVGVVATLTQTVADFRLPGER